MEDRSNKARRQTVSCPKDFPNGPQTTILDTYRTRTGSYNPESKMADPQLEHFARLKDDYSDRMMKTKNYSYNIIESLKIKTHQSNTVSEQSTQSCMYSTSIKEQGNVGGHCDGETEEPCHCAKYKIEEEATRSTLFERKKTKHEMKVFDYNKGRIRNYNMYEGDEKRDDYHAIIKSIAEFRKQEEEAKKEMKTELKTEPEKQKSQERQTITSNLIIEEDSSDIFVFEEVKGESDKKSRLSDSFLWIRKNNSEDDKDVSSNIVSKDISSKFDSIRNKSIRSKLNELFVNSFNLKSTSTCVETSNLENEASSDIFGDETQRQKLSQILKYLKKRKSETDWESKSSEKCIDNFMHFGEQVRYSVQMCKAISNKEAKESNRKLPKENPKFECLIPRDDYGTSFDKGDSEVSKKFLSHFYKLRNKKCKSVECTLENVMTNEMFTQTSRSFHRMNNQTESNLVDESTSEKTKEYTLDSLTDFAAVFRGEESVDTGSDAPLGTIEEKEPDSTELGVAWPEESGSKGTRSCDDTRSSLKAKERSDSSGLSKSVNILHCFKIKMKSKLARRKKKSREASPMCSEAEFSEDGDQINSADSFTERNKVVVKKPFIEDSFSNVLIAGPKNTLHFEDEEFIWQTMRISKDTPNDKLSRNDSLDKNTQNGKEHSNLDDIQYIKIELPEELLFDNPGQTLLQSRISYPGGCPENKDSLQCVDSILVNKGRWQKDQMLDECNKMSKTPVCCSKAECGTAMEKGVSGGPTTSECRSRQLVGSYKGASIIDLGHDDVCDPCDTISRQQSKVECALKFPLEDQRGKCCLSRKYAKGTCQIEADGYTLVCKCKEKKKKRKFGSCLGKCKSKSKRSPSKCSCEPQQDPPPTTCCGNSCCKSQSQKNPPKCKKCKGKTKKEETKKKKKETCTRCSAPLKATSSTCIPPDESQKCVKVDKKATIKQKKNKRTTKYIFKCAKNKGKKADDCIMADDGSVIYLKKKDPDSKRRRKEVCKEARRIATGQALEKIIKNSLSPDEYPRDIKINIKEGSKIKVLEKRMDDGRFEKLKDKYACSKVICKEDCCQRQAPAPPEDCGKPEEPKEKPCDTDKKAEPCKDEKALAAPCSSEEKSQGSYGGHDVCGEPEKKQRPRKQESDTSTCTCNENSIDYDSDPSLASSCSCTDCQYSGSSRKGKNTSDYSTSGSSLCSCMDDKASGKKTRKGCDSCERKNSRTPSTDRLDKDKAACAKNPQTAPPPPPRKEPVEVKRCNQKKKWWSCKKKYKEKKCPIAPETSGDWTDVSVCTCVDENSLSMESSCPPVSDSYEMEKNKRVPSKKPKKKSKCRRSVTPESSCCSYDECSGRGRCTVMVRGNLTTSAKGCPRR